MINGDGGMSPSPVAGVPIAIVGLAGRFPGDASSPQALWDMVLQKKSAWSEIPEDRMNARAYFHPNPSKHSTVSALTTSWPCLLIKSVQHERRTFHEGGRWAL